MGLVHLLIGAAVLQYTVFCFLVGRARGKYGVKAPATTGHAVFERYYRVQMNTLELLAVLLPSAWLAAQYHSPLLIAALLAVYVAGRFVYLFSYVADPAKRSLGFVLSMLPALVLLAAGLLGAARQLLANGL